MNLQDLKTYLMNVKYASLSHLSQYFKCDQILVKQMLRHWVRKGCIKALQRNNCANCTTGCQTELPEIYHWVNTA